MLKDDKAIVGPAVDEACWCDEEVDAYGRIVAAAERAEEMEARVKVLEQALNEYGRHAPGCSAAVSDKYRCRCGWDDARKSISPPSQGAPRTLRDESTPEGRVIWADVDKAASRVPCDRNPMLCPHANEVPRYKDCQCGCCRERRGTTARCKHGSAVCEPCAFARGLRRAAEIARHIEAGSDDPSDWKPGEIAKAIEAEAAHE